MKKLVFWILVSCISTVNAQSLDRTVLASGGVYSQGSGISLSATVGEIASSTLTTLSSILTQGFQQPDGLFVGIVDPLTGKIFCQAFPNPVSSDLTVEINSPDRSELIITLHDMTGRTVLEPVPVNIPGGEIARVQMHVQHLSPAMYFVRISRKSDMQSVETIRIIKSH